MVQAERQCSATAKATGERCRRLANHGFNVCQVHGAGSPRKGRAGGRPIVHGRYSKHLPERLAQRYREAEADPRLVELRDEIKLVDVRMGELLERLSTNESGAAWQAVQVSYTALDDAIRGGDAAAMGVALLGLRSCIQQGLADTHQWDELQELIELRRRLVDSEAKRLATMNQNISVERMLIAVAAIGDILKRHVPDRTILSAVSAEIRSLVVYDPGQ